MKILLYRDCGHTTQDRVILCSFPLIFVRHIFIFLDIMFEICQIVQNLTNKPDGIYVYLAYEGVSGF